MDTKLYTASQVRALDRLAIEQSGISGYDLMCRAGQVVFDVICREYPQARHLHVYCGAGNNAGDGYVIARLAHRAGLVVSVIQLSDPVNLQGSALQAFQGCQDAGVAVASFDEGGKQPVDLVVDALLGTGLQRDLRGQWQQAVARINHSGCPVIAVDIPTGLIADTGHVRGAVVCADITVTFIGRKRGLYTAQGPDCCGRIIFDDLRVPDAVYRQSAIAFEEEAVFLNHPSLLPPRLLSTHKGQTGHVLIVGGNEGMAGAGILAAQAALRGGAGLVSLATRAGNVVAAVSVQPEIMAHAIESRNALCNLCKRADVIAIGPGLGRDDWAGQMLSGVLEQGKPLVLDADGLDWLVREPVTGDRWVLTPHPGEAARLLGCTVADIQADRFAAVKALQIKYGGAVILKGAGSLILDKRLSVNTTGNPGMATAGMGDMLTGLIAALLAQGMKREDALCHAVHIHGMAADQNVDTYGERGLVATDLLPGIRRLLNV